MLNSSYYFILITIFAYAIGKFISEKLKTSFANPMLIGTILIIIVLKASNIDYHTYMKGGKYLNIFIGPATVSLVVPMNKNIDLIKKNLIPILGGIISGSITAIISVLVLCKIFNLNNILTISLLPQSITTAIAFPLSEDYGGIGSVTIMAVILRGIFGAIMCVSIYKKAIIKDVISQGIALGTASHVIGTSKAFEISEGHGAMASLAIVISGILTVIYMMIAIHFV